MSDHRRFLKSSTTAYEVGEYIPKKVQLFQNQASVDLSWIYESSLGSVLFFLSGGCEACDINPIKRTIEHYPELDFAVFYEGPTREEEAYFVEKKVQYYYCDLAKIEKELLVKVAPFQLVVNNVGQVITAGVCNHEEHIENLLSPLTRLLANRK
ncbi:hypothetical protein [Paenibacillus tundrae]|uniref:Thioredoxin domain-containing protein n=1 Tax=Paenibacillus tundrae TaxID=528187 RepID=A0ABT9WG08_9BACL|nr:hypothetical protein [Paenibacillus tundrae]MDQ0172208.1 hypothetical protein [Paenibacillus tundrae]